MPHIKDEIKVALNTTDRQVVEPGDACWLFADFALAKYNEEPRWATIHKIKVALRNPYHDSDTHNIIRSKMGHMSKADIEAAAELAFMEFYRLVGSAYEDVKAIENGNCFATAKVPTPKVEVKENVVDNQTPSEQATQPVSSLQGTGEVSKRGRKRVDNPTV